MTKRQILAIVLLLSFIAIDVYGILNSSVPNVTIPFIQAHTVSYWNRTVAPPIFVRLHFLFTATGSLSVNNHVQVHVTLTDANISNVLQYYGWIGFTDAYNISTVGNPEQGPNLAFIPITASSTPDEYMADGMVVWLKEGPSWPFLVPASGGQIVLKQSDIEIGTPVVTIASIADTLSIQNSIREQQLTWILVGFSVLALQPIFGVFIPHNPSNPPTESPRQQGQGLWREDRKKNQT